MESGGWRAEGGGWSGRRWDDDAVRLHQLPDPQQGAVHGGPTAVEQYGEGFRGQGIPQVKDGCQDLVVGGKASRGGRPRLTSPWRDKVLVRSLSCCRDMPGQGGVRQKSVVPLRGRPLRRPESLQTHLAVCWTDCERWKKPLGLTGRKSSSPRGVRGVGRQGSSVRCVGGAGGRCTAASGAIALDASICVETHPITRAARLVPSSMTRGPWYA